MAYVAEKTSNIWVCVFVLVWFFKFLGLYVCGCHFYFFPSQFVIIKFRRDSVYIGLGCGQRKIKEGIPNISHECTLCKVGGKGSWLRV